MDLYKDFLYVCLSFTGCPAKEAGICPGIFEEDINGKCPDEIVALSKLANIDCYCAAFPSRIMAYSVAEDTK